MEGTMRIEFIRLAISVLVIAGGEVVGGEPKGDRNRMKGVVVDLGVYLGAGDRGAGKKARPTACAKAGNPIGLVDGQGQVYVTAGLKDHEPGRVMLLDKMSREVTVTGTLVRNGGVQMIYVESVR